METTRRKALSLFGIVGGLAATSAHAFANLAEDDQIGAPLPPAPKPPPTYPGEGMSYIEMSDTWTSPRLLLNGGKVTFEKNGKSVDLEMGEDGRLWTRPHGSTKWRPL